MSPENAFIMGGGLKVKVKNHENIAGVGLCIALLRVMASLSVSYCYVFLCHALYVHVRRIHKHA